LYYSGATSNLLPVKPRIAVLIPCYNEGVAIGRVVREFRAVLPDATVWVYDNNSSDDTRAQAAAAGAEVREEGYQGKGNVVRRMFADVDADLYVLVDGDATYDAASAPRLVAALVEGRCDMVNGSRRSIEEGAYRAGHRFGNRLLTGMVRVIFGRQITDMLSGYRAFTRRFVKSFPALSAGFEIETELTVHALELRMPIAEIETPYYARPTGSSSKLSTYRDGWRILLMILKLMKGERPLPFFSAIAAMLAAVSIVIGVQLSITFMETGLVPRFPSAVLATGLMLSAMLSLAAGLILDTVTKGRHEMKRLAYLAIPPLDARVES
jgi:glycosyltransferase involved in cell wall biosynthesis